MSSAPMLKVSKVYVTTPRAQNVFEKFEWIKSWLHQYHIKLSSCCYDSTKQHCLMQIYNNVNFYDAVYLIDLGFF